MSLRANFNTKNTEYIACEQIRISAVKRVLINKVKKEKKHSKFKRQCWTTQTLTAHGSVKNELPLQMQHGGLISFQ